MFSLIILSLWLKFSARSYGLSIQSPKHVIEVGTKWQQIIHFLTTWFNADKVNKHCNESTDSHEATILDIWYTINLNNLLTVPIKLKL